MGEFQVSIVFAFHGRQCHTIVLRGLLTNRWVLSSKSVSGEVKLYIFNMASNCGGNCQLGAGWAS